MGNWMENCRMKRIEVNPLQEKRLLELLDKGLAYDDEHYSNKTTNADQKLVDRIKKQLKEGIKKTKTFNCWKCDEIFDAKIIVGKTESVTCPCCGRENRVKR